MPDDPEMTPEHLQAKPVRLSTRDLWVLLPVVAAISVAVVTAGTIALGLLFDGSRFDWGGYWRGWRQCFVLFLDFLLLVVAWGGITYWVQRKTGKSIGEWIEASAQTRAAAYLFMGALLSAVALGVSRGCAGS